jgi:DNA-binding transcriptional regulator GbsR (MarR family)
MILDDTSPDPHGFDPEIRKIEKEIIKFFSAKAVELQGRHPIIATVMTYFYTRSNLTQRDLQIMTGYSAGTISKALRQLVDMNVITRNIIPGTHKHIYRMESYPFTSPQFFMRTENLLGNVEKDLMRMKETLDENAKEMQKLEGYQQMYATVTQLLKLLPLSTIFISKLEEELKNLSKNERA